MPKRSLLRVSLTKCMLNIEIVRQIPYIEIVINMESEYGFNREVIITDRITSAVTRRHPNNRISSFEIEELPRHSPAISNVSSEEKYERISFKVIEEPSHHNWVAFLGLSLALFSTIQGICESISMFLAIDHSGISEHRSIPAYVHLILAYGFLFNAALVLSLSCCDNLIYITTVWIISIISWILSTWLSFNNYGMNMLQLIWESFQETSSNYDKIIVASWASKKITSDEHGFEKYIFPDKTLVGLACAQNGSVLCIQLLLILCIATTFALLIDFKMDFKDSSSLSSVSPITFENDSKTREEEAEKKMWFFGVAGILFIFFGIFANFSLFIINNLYVYSGMHDSHPYEVYAGGPRYALFFGLTTVGLLSMLYYMTYSKWVKFILFIFSIASLGCAIYSLFALRAWYAERLSEDGVYTGIQECSIIPHLAKNEFCVFNCTFEQSNSLNYSHKEVVCNELCISSGICFNSYYCTISMYV